MKYNENHPGVNIFVNEITENLANVWMQRKCVLENIRELHFRKYMEYSEEVRLITSAEFNDDASKDQKLKSFMSKDFTEHWNAGLIMILKELMSLWEIIYVDDMEIDNAEEVY